MKWEWLKEILEWQRSTKAENSKCGYRVVGLYRKERELPLSSVGTGNQIPIDNMLETRSLASSTVLMAALTSLSVCLGKSACKVLINPEACDKLACFHTVIYKQSGSRSKPGS